MKFFARNKQSPRQPRPGNEQQGYAFRRSRTLTGTTSPKVTAASEKRSQLKTVRLKAHELHQLRARVLKILAVIVVCIGVLAFVIASYIGKIDTVYTQPGGKPATAQYQKSILDYFGKHPLERFAFSTNIPQLDAFMQQAHPEIIGFDMTKNWYGGNAQFVIAFRKPILVWETSGQRFYVDTKGVAFQYDNFGGQYVAVSDQSGISPSSAGGSVASNRFISFLGKMVGAVNAGGKGSVVAVIIPASTRHIDLKLQG